jgi:ferric-dicitrate binding protein FerR (iron transport regulator)
VEAKGSDAVAETEKGEFSMLADGQGQVSVAARKGRVRLSAKNKTVDIEAGMLSTVQAETAPATPEPFSRSLCF